MIPSKQITKQNLECAVFAVRIPSWRKPCSCPTPAVQRPPWHGCPPLLSPSFMCYNFSERLKILLKYLDLIFCTFSTGSLKGDTSVWESRGRKVRYAGENAAVSVQNPSPPSKGTALHVKNTSKSSLALPPKQSTLNKFYYLAISRSRLKVVPYFKSKAGIQETTVKEMKHNVNIWVTASLLELETPTDALVN